ncbi:MAG TPA: hypothetical protein VMI75_03485, partial [Polyangiaceae bacterium]|nr:hypothetical protein [Polyangiaceae bacterium]
MRRAQPEDLRFIAHAWVQEVRHAFAARGVPDDLYYAHQRSLVLALVRRAHTLVAVDPEDPWHLYGFVTFELGPGRLHWV